jgi:hypothetical protein
MKKSLLAIGITLTVAAAMSGGQSMGELADRPLYANIFLTVWQLENDHSDFLLKLQTPIPEVFAKSWLSSSFFQDISDGRPHTRSFEKETLRIDLITGKPDELTIQVWEAGAVIFKSIHQRSSTLRTIFYDSDSRPYLLDVNFTCQDSPIGIFGVGPRKLH